MMKFGFMKTTAALGFFAVTGLGSSTLPDTPLTYARQSTETVVEVSNTDIATSNAKVRAAHAALADMWRGYFRDVGDRFDVPGLVRYRGGAVSACGLMRRNNAGYCPGDNTIYFDEVFVAAQAKEAARQLGTDGDMAAIGIIAHEMGHAVSLQLGYRSRSTYAMESAADCLAGAFTEQAKRDGSLENGDIEEAFFGMAAAGDPTPELTGDTRVDRRILRVASIMGHGTREQRTDNFRRGLEGGPGACLDIFRT
ncbi:MAG TPA: neutral zinc metallopeptidase [Gemmatimonadaceae bacterium]|nr:neutral zinc metallopeptidase [Gemmatimonadaceae bacterium]